MRPSLSLICACVAAALALASNAQAGKGGTLDPSFGVRTAFSGGNARALAIQADGRIVVVGSTGAVNSGSFAVARFEADGDLDPTFGVGGEVTTHVSSDGARAVVLQPDGRIVLAGVSYTGGIGRVMLVRYEATGALDASFGTGGIVVTAPISDASVTGLALQADGRLVVVGKDSDAFMIRRYEADGSVDGTFGTGGVTITPIGPTITGAADVAIEPGGAIVVVGSAQNGSGQYELALARYTSDGTLDASFGTGGIVTTAVGIAGVTVEGLARDASGRILVVGTSQTMPADGVHATLVRFDAAGALDASFGSGGVAVDGLVHGLGADVAVQNDGKLVMVGTEAVSFFGSILQAVARVVRFDANGVLDPTFGSGGGTSSQWHSHSSMYAVALAADGRIVVAGYKANASQSYPYFAIDNQFTVARYLAGICGDANLEAGEQCDDGNVADGDCCSGSCDFNAAGTLCDDGQSDICTAPDECDGAGTCIGHIPVACAPCEACDLGSGCVPTIRPSCKTQVTPGAGRLTVRDTLDSRKHKLQWQWAAGAATTLDELGSPDTTDDLAICLFDSGSQLVASAPVPAGGTCDGKPCWTPNTHGFRFRSRDGAPGGIVGAQLREGVAGKAKIKIDGKGANLATPATASLSLPLRVQLQSENGECWEATYSASGVLRQDGEWFKGRSD